MRVKRSHKFMNCRHLEDSYLGTQEVIFVSCSTKLCVSDGRLPIGIWMRLKAQCKSMFEVFKCWLSAQTCLLTPFQAARYDKCCNDEWPSFQLSL